MYKRGTQSQVNGSIDAENMCIEHTDVAIRNTTSTETDMSAT